MAYKRKKVNIQSKIIWELHKEHPLSFTKLRKRITEKSISNFYANLNLLLEFGIVRFVDKEVTMVKSTYALIDFKTLDENLSKTRMMFDVENLPIEHIACGYMHDPRMFGERILCRKCGMRYHEGRWIRNDPYLRRF